MHELVRLSYLKILHFLCYDILANVQQRDIFSMMFYMDKEASKLSYATITFILKLSSISGKKNYLNLNGI